MAASDKALALQIASSEEIHASPKGCPLACADVLARARAYEGYLDGTTLAKANETKSITYAAKVAHDVVRAHHIASGEPNPAPKWGDCDKDLQTSVKIGVKRIMDDPSITHEQLHDSWLETKAGQGWTYGAERSDELKQHPCMLPYSELSDFQRTKDALFSAAVRAALGIEEV